MTILLESHTLGYCEHFKCQSSISGFSCIHFYFINGAAYSCSGVGVTFEPCRPAIQAKKGTKSEKPPQEKVGLETL